jgi:hypothetical protein
MEGTGHAAGGTGAAAAALTRRLGRAVQRWANASVTALTRAVFGRLFPAATSIGRPAARAAPVARHDRFGPRERSDRRPFDPACPDGGCRCPPGWDACGTERCRFLPMAHAHCGGCGVACRPDQLCSNGRCV